MYFVIDRLVGLDASCLKHTLFFKMTPPLNFNTCFYENKMGKNASLDMIVLDWSPNFSVFKIVKCLLF
jgi:hypothetical protein